jgi:hypothetical protein
MGTQSGPARSASDVAAQPTDRVNAPKQSGGMELGE